MDSTFSLSTMVCVLARTKVADDPAMHLELMSFLTGSMALDGDQYARAKDELCRQFPDLSTEPVGRIVEAFKDELSATSHSLWPEAIHKAVDDLAVILAIDPDRDVLILEPCAARSAAAR